MYQEKYGIRDYRGGGRSSARETATRVAAAAIAKLVLMQKGVRITGFVSQVSNIKLKRQEIDYSQIEQNIVRTANAEVADKMILKIEEARKNGDSLGGKITCHIYNCPIGLGEPVFDKLDADLAKAMLSIPAVKGFEIGSGFSAIEMSGSEHNDAFIKTDGKISTLTNHSGGVQGGISNGQLIHFNVAFKPVATISKEQETVNKKGEEVTLKAKGRHDPCVVPRAVPIVEAMAALVLCDHFLRQRANNPI